MILADRNNGAATARGAALTATRIPWLPQEAFRMYRLPLLSGRWRWVPSHHRPLTRFFASRCPEAGDNGVNLAVTDRSSHRLDPTGRDCYCDWIVTVRVLGGRGAVCGRASCRTPPWTVPVSACWYARYGVTRLILAIGWHSVKRRYHRFARRGSHWRRLPAWTVRPALTPRRVQRLHGLRTALHVQTNVQLA